MLLLFKLLISVAYGQKEQEVKDFVLATKPTYIGENDTLVVARLPKLTDRLNEYVYEELKRGEYSLLPCALIYVLKLNKEFFLVNKTDYDLCIYYNYALVDLLRARLNIPDDDLGCIFYKTYNVYEWAIKNQEVFLEEEELLNLLEELKLLYMRRE